MDGLYAMHHSVQTAGFNDDSYKPGLERMQAVSVAMGYPETDFRSVHVAGTNGKGSVCSMLAASLAAGGLRVGLFTSPHLLDFRERIKIVEDGGFRLIGKDDVVEFARSFDLQGLTFFELTTAMAFWYFSRSQVDIAVIEVGLGGLLDSTNIIEPEISIVTSIGLDHCAILGDTRAAIAAQKAGIFKPGVPALVGIRDDETAPVFEECAASAHCPLFFADDWPEPEMPPMDLKGDCQRENLRTVLAALELLGEEPDMQAIASAAQITGLRGRWEAVSDRPLTIADIGHNPPALKENFAQLQAMMASGAYSSLIIVYGVMADKDLDGIIPFMPEDAQYVFVTPDTPRALPSERIMERFLTARPGAGERVRAIASVKELSGVLAAIPSYREDALVYVGGSTFVVADYLSHS